MANKEMRVKILKAFLSPLNNRMSVVGAEHNVPRHRFWLKRIAEGDCEKVTRKKRAESAPKKKAKTPEPAIPAKGVEGRIS